MRTRLKLAWKLLMGHSVMYRIHVVPWAGRAPRDGESVEGWVRIGPTTKRFFYVIDCELARPVFVMGGKLDVQEEGLPYVWRPEEVEE